MAKLMRKNSYCRLYFQSPCGMLITFGAWLCVCPCVPHILSILLANLWQQSRNFMCFACLVIYFTISSYIRCVRVNCEHIYYKKYHHQQRQQQIKTNNTVVPPHRLLSSKTKPPHNHLRRHHSLLHRANP